MRNETGTHWMVVDDDTETLQVVTRLLAAVSSAEIHSFPSASQALDALAATPEAYQLIVTDYEMPGMNGLDFRRQIETVSPATKVLLTTGSGKFTDESARENGFCGLLCKPFSIEALKQTLTRVIANHFSTPAAA